MLSEECEREKNQGCLNALFPFGNLTQVNGSHYNTSRETDTRWLSFYKLHLAQYSSKPREISPPSFSSCIVQ